MDGSNQKDIDAAQVAELARIEQRIEQERKDLELATELEAHYMVEDHGRNEQVHKDEELAGQLLAGDVGDAFASAHERTEQERKDMELAAKLAQEEEEEAKQTRLADEDREFSE